MFLITQLIGLYVVNFYISDGITIPYGFDNKDVSELSAPSILGSMITSFVIAILLIFVLMRYKLNLVIKIWFFLVISFALGITLNILALKSGIIYPSYTALILAIILTYLKMFKTNSLTHNITELLIYPGIAAIFVAMLNWWVTIILLILISIYDIWAVWHSGVMQKMAKFQIDNLGVLGGFMIPYASKKMKEKIKFLKLKYKNSKIPQSVVKKNKLKIALAILGGGDIVFPIIAAGVMLKTLGLTAALTTTAGATLALIYLLSTAEKKKFYPAMPYLSTGIILGMLLGYILTLL